MPSESDTNCAASMDRGADGLSGEQSVRELLAGFGRGELRRRRHRAGLALREVGLQMEEEGARRKDASRPDTWKMDLYPHLPDADEWQVIRRGVLQRGAALNAYLKDIYGEQDILRQRLLPMDVVLRDPAFHRQFASLQPDDAYPCQFAAFDLLKTDDGKWRVLDQHLGTPFGLAFVLQNRRIVSQIVPELIDRVNPAPVADFSTRLTELLRSRGNSASPHVVLLTHGDRRQDYFEAGFLGRHLGITVAQPGDLVVLDGYVHLKTIRGLQRVDVIFRRVDSLSFDPIAIPGSTMYGVAGLSHVVRKKRVAILNALGSGVADNRALHRYMHRIIGFYTNEKAILPAVKTYNLADYDQRNYVGETLEQFVIRPVQDHDFLWSRCGRDRRPLTQRGLVSTAMRYPQLFVAQERMRVAPITSWMGDQPTQSAFYLRVFCLLGDDPVVLPGGLTQEFPGGGVKARRRTLQSSNFKDTMIVAGEGDLMEQRTRSHAESFEGTRLAISSRVAESLYWLGRYIERAENTSRQFRILENLRWDQLGRSERRLYWPLLKAIASVTDHEVVAKLKSPPRDTIAFSRDLLLNPDQPASVYACLLAARANLAPIRDVVSPECHFALEDAFQSAAQLTYAGKLERRDLTAFAQNIVSEVAHFNGLAERTFVHDDGLQFYHAGVYLERAVATLELLKNVLPHAIRNHASPAAENTDLTALLRIFASLDAYRREYRSRAYLDRVARLLLMSPTNPSSVQFCLRKLAYGLGTIRNQSDFAPASADAVTDTVRDLIDHVAELPIRHLLPSTAESLDEGGRDSIPRGTATRVEGLLTELAEAVAGLHDRIDEVYFSHQSTFQEPDLLRF